MRVIKRNTWGNLTYSLNGAPIKSTSGAVKLIDGTMCNYHSVLHDEKVWDNSPVPYTVTSNRLMVAVPFQGKTIDVPIEDVDITTIIPNPTNS